MRLIALVYSVAVYALFLGSFVYLIPFLGGDMTAFIGAPKTIDAGTSPLDGAPPALVNIGLLLLFGVQHSIMARAGFKKALTRIIPAPAERATYVLASVVLLALLYICWIPMDGVVWTFAESAFGGAAMAIYFLGIGLILASTFQINHFELFGLLQAWLGFKQKEAAPAHFQTPFLYRIVRHPLYLGFVIAFWATAHMTVGHLLFAAIWTIYIFVAVGYEERDMLALFGDQYRDYMAKVPSIFPFGVRK